MAQIAIEEDHRFPVKLQFWFQTRCETNEEHGGPKPAVRFAVKYLEPGRVALTGDGRDYARTTTLEVTIVRAVWVPRWGPYTLIGHVIPGGCALLCTMFNRSRGPVDSMLSDANVRLDDTPDATAPLTCGRRVATADAEFVGCGSSSGMGLIRA